MTAGAAGHDPPVPAAAPPLPTAPRPRTEAGPDGLHPPLGATGVLADRIAAALVHREPGWRLPRRSALARRYGVSLTEIDAAIAELTRRSLVRRLPDGQLYRASPADYWIPVEGVDGLGTRLDPMGSTITCQSRHVSRREAPQDVAWALGLPSGGLVRMVRCVWSAGGDPAAVSTAYLPETALGAGDDDDPDAPVLADAAQAGGGQAGGGQAGAAQAGAGQADAEVASFDALLSGPAAAVSLEMSPPQPAVARSLRLSPGQPVITVTVRFDDAETGRPAALTVVVLKPELFRVALEATGAPAAAPTLSVSVSKGQLPGLSGRYLRL